MRKFISRTLYALIFSVFLGFHLCADSLETEGAKEKFKVELTPLGDYIYKIPEVLNKENWAIFLNIVNSASEKLNLENIQFDIYSNSKLISTETNYYDKIINPDSNYKLDLIFFRKNISLNCDRMKVTVITNFGKKILNIELKRYKQPIDIYFPLKGVWQVVSAQEFGITHRRHDDFGQFAYDFSIFDKDGNLYKGNPTNLNDYYAFGKPVYAPADCTVYKVNDGIEDNTVIGKSAIHANYVRLDLGNNILCTMVHFKKGSIVVKEGQKLKRGDKIAEVGNSGGSNYPHLHMQIQNYNINSNEPLKPGKPLPLLFSDIELHPLYYYTWKFYKSGYPKTGDYIKSTKKNETTINNQAVIKAKSWIVLLDNKKYTKSWHETTKSLEVLVSEKTFIKNISSLRKRLGKVDSRKFKSIEYKATLGELKGKYAIVQFHTSFKNLKSAIETVVLKQTKDNIWKIGSYYVK